MSYMTTKTVKLFTGRRDPADGMVEERIELEEHEQLVGIQSISFLIAEAGSVEPPIDVVVDMITQSDAQVKESQTIELPETGEVTLSVVVNQFGAIGVSVVSEESDEPIDCYITAKAKVELETIHPPKPSQTEVEKEEPETESEDEKSEESFNLQDHAVKPMESTATMQGREHRIIYHAGQEDTIFVIGLEEDLNESDLSKLSDFWQKEDLADLSTDDYRLVKSDKVIRLTFDRAVNIQNRLEETIRGIYGIPTMIAWWRGVNYHLPLVDRDGKPIEAVSIASLDLEFWTQSKLSLPREFDGFKKDPNHPTDRLIDVKHGLALQMQWVWTMRQ